MATFLYNSVIFSISHGVVLRRIGATDTHKFNVPYVLVYNKKNVICFTIFDGLTAAASEIMLNRTQTKLFFSQFFLASVLRIELKRKQYNAFYCFQTCVFFLSLDSKRLPHARWQQ